MKKQLLILTFFTFVTGFSFAQKADVRLEKKYSPKEITQMIQDNPAQYNVLVYALDHACYVIDQPVEKDLSGFTTIPVDVTKPLNFLDLGLEIKEQNQYFLIQGTSKMLVVKSNWVLNHELTTKK
jgi:hypothetical protein